MTAPTPTTITDPLRRWALRLVTGLIAAPVLYFLAGMGGALIPGGYADVPGARTERVGFVRGPIHYDLLLPLTPETRAAFAFVQAQGMPINSPRAEWLVLGWGAEQFYTTVGTLSDMSAGAVLHAALGEGAVIRLDLAGNVDGVTSLRWLNVSAAQMAALRRVSLAALERDAAGQPIPHPGTNWAEGRMFYAAKGNFHLGHTCNAWLGETLRAAGIPFGLWTPTPQAFALSLSWFGES